MNKSSKTALLSTVLGAAAGLCVGLDASPAQAFASLRCGNELVTEGDSLYEVRTTCGEPNQLDSYVEFRTVRHRVRQNCQRDTEGRTQCDWVWVERTVEVQMHRALYDFGPNRFLHELLFEQGRLVRSETRGYGKKKPDEDASHSPE
jgi:hypothetical protein